MKRISSILLSSVFVIGLCLSQSERSEGKYDGVEYSLISDTTFVIIQTSEGSRITLEVPPGKCLAVFYSDSSLNSAKTDPFFLSAQQLSSRLGFYGSKSIRTKQTTDLRKGDTMDDQMRVVPLRMDFTDATVAIRKKNQ